MSSYLLYLPKQPDRDIPKTVEYVPAQHCLQTLDEAAPVTILLDQPAWKLPDQDQLFADWHNM